MYCGGHPDYTIEDTYDCFIHEVEVCTKWSYFDTYRKTLTHHIKQARLDTDHDTKIENIYNLLVLLQLVIILTKRVTSMGFPLCC
jgi:hypothetical protein